HHKFVFIFRLGIGVTQFHREVGGVTAAETIDRYTASERPNETDLDLVLRFDGPSREPQRRKGGRRGDSISDHGDLQMGRSIGLDLSPIDSGVAQRNSLFLRQNTLFGRKNSLFACEGSLA